MLSMAARTLFDGHQTLDCAMLLCTLLMSTQLSLAAAEGVILMLHGSNVQTVCTGAVLKSVASWSQNSAQLGTHAVAITCLMCCNAGH